MGEVYQARDTRLKRDIAIKVLPLEFEQDPDRIRRFEHEAEALAALNHPNIAAIHALEESNGIRFLVLELVEGETLSDRLRKGLLSPNEVTSIGLQICGRAVCVARQGHRPPRFETRQHQNCARRAGDKGLFGLRKRFAFRPSGAHKRLLVPGEVLLGMLAAA
jgi:serine/threonine protein kinase